MDEKQGETAARADAAKPEEGARRADAAAYLDLWERHVTHAAVYGPPAPPRRPGG